MFWLFRFCWSAVKQIRKDRATVETVDEDAARHRAYHQRILWCGGVFGAIGLLIGGGVTVELVREAGWDWTHGTRALIAAPLMLGVAGTCFGVALACLFAPRSFLEGPLGKKWMAFIGTRSVFRARIVCLLVGLVVGGLLSGLGILLLGQMAVHPP
jgi:hypothetical protein